MNKSTYPDHWRWHPEWKEATEERRARIVEAYDKKIKRYNKMMVTKLAMSIKSRELEIARLDKLIKERGKL